MCYLGIDRPLDLTRGDMIRLGLLDDAGPSETLPYSSSGLKDFEEQYCYDPFWGPRFEAPFPLEMISPTCNERVPEPAPGPWSTTRYICSGYGFTVLGEAENRFFKNPIHQHFGHHYFKLCLIAHFHKASLLMFSERLSDAVKEFQSSGRSDVEDARYRAFRDKVSTIQGEMLRFRSRYWFTEVSNQVQAKALFELWMKHLGTRELFTQVFEEAKTINDWLLAEEQAQRTDEATRLTVVATVGLAVSIIVNILAWASMPQSKWAALTTVAVGLGTLCVLLLSTSIGKFFRGLTRLTRKVRDWFRRRRKSAFDNR